jgi:ParB family chromosome partitioning protein
MSVREAESLVKKLSAEFNLVSPKPKKEKSRDLKRVEEELSDLLTAEVEVRVKKRVKRHGRIEEMGELAIQFGSLDELERADRPQAAPRPARAPRSKNAQAR